jgi:hypothetical protein
MHAGPSRLIMDDFYVALTSPDVALVGAEEETNLRDIPVSSFSLRSLHGTFESLNPSKFRINDKDEINFNADIICLMFGCLKTKTKTRNFETKFQRISSGSNKKQINLAR